jgi:hypothetical protein
MILQISTCAHGFLPSLPTKLSTMGEENYLSEGFKAVAVHFLDTYLLGEYTVDISLADYFQL